MKTFNTATARRVGLAIAFLGGSILAAPAMAACNPNARAQSEAQTLPELTNGLPTTVLDDDRVIASYTLLSSIGRLDVKTLNLDTPDYLPEVHYHQVRDAWHGLRTPSGQ